MCMEGSSGGPIGHIILFRNSRDVLASLFRVFPQFLLSSSLPSLSSSTFTKAPFPLKLWLQYMGRLTLESISLGLSLFSHLPFLNSSSSGQCLCSVLQFFCSFCTSWISLSHTGVPFYLSYNFMGSWNPEWSPSEHFWGAFLGNRGQEIGCLMGH